MWEKIIASIVSIFIFYYKENILQSCTITKSNQYVGTQLQKATTFAHSPTPIIREFQPLDQIHQLPLEGIFDFLTKGSNP